MKERLATPRMRSTRTRLPMKIVWEDPQDGLIEKINEIVGGIVVVWIMSQMNHITLLSSQ